IGMPAAPRRRFGVRTAAVIAVAAAALAAVIVRGRPIITRPTGSSTAAHERLRHKQERAAQAPAHAEWETQKGIRRAEAEYAAARARLDPRTARMLGERLASTRTELPAKNAGGDDLEARSRALDGQVAYLGSLQSALAHLPGENR